MGNTTSKGKKKHHRALTHGSGASTKELESSITMRENLIAIHAQSKGARRSSATTETDTDAEVLPYRGDLIGYETKENAVSSEYDAKNVLMRPAPGVYKRLRNVLATHLQIQANYKARFIPKTTSEMKFLEECLKDHFIFSALTPKEISLLLNAMECFGAKEGEMIIRQGDYGDYFYVLRKGMVTVWIDGAQVGCLRRGGTFGDVSLLYNSPRPAGVRAEKDCELYRVDHHTFRATIANYQAHNANENIQLLRKVDLFRDMEDTTLTKISDSLTVASFRDGKIVMRKGDAGKIIYIVKQGRVLLSDIGDGKRTYVDQTLTVGDFFGERAVLTGTKHAATATAVGDCVLFCLSKDTIDKTFGPLLDAVEFARDKRKLMGIPAIAKANLEPYQIDELTKRLQKTVLKEGEAAFSHGDDMMKYDRNKRGLCLIMEGEMALSDEDGDVTSAGRGDYIGPNSLRRDDMKNMFVAKEETVCKFLTVDDIEDVVGSVERLDKTRSSFASKVDRSVHLNVLQKHKLIGVGTFGQVWLVTHTKTNEPFALKIQSKRKTIERGSVSEAVREKNMMASVDHPFIIKLVNAFQDANNLFLVLEFVQGGELFSRVHTKTRDGIPEPDSKFYAACVLEALKHMHRRSILYRDLKSENVLIGRDGYCVIIDLGFAKVVRNKTYTMCGTPMYLAPEVILSRGYDKGADHWAFGVLVYEMLVGFPPFYNPRMNQAILFRRIVRAQYRFPEWSNCGEDARDFVERLLVVKQTERLGSLAGGDSDISDHRWLLNINAQHLVSKKLKAPWIPEIRDAMDASNFEILRNVQDGVSDENPLSQEEQRLFSNF